jgi:transposase
MSHDLPDDPKIASLRRHGTLVPRPERITDPLFEGHEFFDPRDLIQVKYEMLRRVRLEGQPIRRAAAAFGFSRPSYYQAQAAFEQEGLVGLVPRKRGPRGAHKLTEEVLAAVEQMRQAEPELGSQELVERLEQRLGLEVHPRSLERALARRKKKRQ